MIDMNHKILPNANIANVIVDVRRTDILKKIRDEAMLNSFRYNEKSQAKLNLK